MRLIFMGTPDFAGVILTSLIEAGHDICLVVTQPDRPKGRSGENAPSPVKVIAAEHDIPVFQPERIKQEENVARVLEVPCDAVIVAAFGQILPKAILEHGKYGCINVHASLLPRYRGAAPIQCAILNGDEVTGITIMQMAEGVDDGDILYTAKLPIREDHTGGSLFDELSWLGAKTLLEALSKIDELTPVPQDERLATRAGKIDKSMGKLDFSKSSAEILRYIRGLNPWPSAYTYLDGKLLKLWRAGEARAEAAAGLDKKAPGEMVSDDERLFIRTGDGAIEVFELQLEGRRRMDTKEFLRGVRI